MSGVAQKLPERDAVRMLEFAGQQFLPLPSGALFWPDHDALLVADLHLEKMSSFARSGQFLPPYDSYATLRHLDRDIARVQPRRVISLGDSFHRDEGTITLPPDARALLTQLQMERDWVWISGNHDPSPHDLGGECCEEMRLSGILLTHEPHAEPTPTIAGHLHPAAHLRINGRSTRRPCFAADNRLLMMPAYGVSTGSLNILSAPFSGLFDFSSLQVVMLGRDEVYPVPVKRLVRR